MADINIAPIDRYTSAHAGMGVLLARAQFPWWGALLASIVWEISENGLKRQFPRLFPYTSIDSWWNAAVDTAAFMAGYAVARSIMREPITIAGKLVLDAAVGTTIGGALGSAAFGVAGGQGFQQNIDLARLGYRVGGSIGGATGILLGKGGLLVAAAAAIGAGVIGPAGAALSTYLVAKET